MRKNRLLAVLLAAALTAALILPAGAAGSSFSDISDPDTAVNADILRLMGVADGVGDDRFNPDATLTRAEFCTMVVKFMQKGDEVSLHAARTIFSDVTARHWALPFVNLAASLTVADGEQSVPLISGVGNGKFEPDSRITLAQASTILIRVLGYSSKQAGALWPQSYMDLASSIGLTDGVAAGYYDPITRAQAARLFVNALGCKTGSGGIYYATLGAVKENAILLAVGVPTGDGTCGGAIRTSLEATPYLPAAGEVRPAALLGKRGALVLNDKDEILTFVPDDSNAITVTLSGDAQPAYMKGADGTRYTVPADASVYVGGQDGMSYTVARDQLKSGMTVTLYSSRGRIEAIYAAGSMAAGTQEAVVVQGEPAAALFHALTGGAENYTIQKDRQTIALSDLKPYDVVTWDGLSRTLLVSGLRLTCVYEDAAPNGKAPTTITALGHAFPVLDSAWESIDDFDLGDRVTLLLTCDGSVAGMVSYGVKSTATGVVTAEGAQLFLPDGGQIALKGSLSGEKETGRLVSISSSSAGKLNLAALSGKNSGDFHVSSMKLGGRTVAAGARIYEQVKGGLPVPVILSDLNADTVSAEDVVLYHENTSGMVDILVLGNVTGNAYVYGILTEGIESGELGNRTVSVDNGMESLQGLITGASFKDGSFGGAAAGVDRKAADVVKLEKLEDISPSDFFTSEGSLWLRAEGQVYRVSPSVVCYKTAADSWFAGDTAQERLAACRAFSAELSAYLDPIGMQVRVVAAE